MDSGPAPILPLTVQTVSLLRASQLLPSLPATLLYLLRHLLDLAPAASQLSLTLDPARWAVTIQLDGQGLETAAYNQLAAGEGIGLVGRVSLLELEGRDRTTGALRTTIVKGGTVLHDGPSAAGARNQGTTLRLRDLFYNLPIRRRSAPSPAALQARCLRVVEQLSLARFLLAFRIWESGKEDPLWRVRSAGSDEERFAQLHGSALLKTPTAIAAESGSLRLSGFISLAATHSRSTEYLSINRRPLVSSNSLLQTLISDLFADSSFAERAQAETEPGLSGASPIKIPRGPGNERSPRKAIRRPVYALNLVVLPGEVVWEGSEGESVEFEDWPKVKAFVTSVVCGFLEQNGFSRLSSSRSSRAKRRLDFDLDQSDERSTIGKKMRQEDSPLKRVSLDGFVPTAEPDVVSYRDPTTKKVFKLDRQTGSSLQIGTSSSQPDNKQEKAFTPPWLKEVLDTWVNSAFPFATEMSIPTSSSAGTDANTGLPFHAVSSLSTSTHDVSVPELQKALQTAKVITQVDQKFLACLLQISGPPSTLDPSAVARDRRLLFLIDQHAADERIRVERSLCDLGRGFLANCRHETSTILDAIPLVVPPTETFILLTAAERQALASLTAAQLALARWGISFDLPPTPSGENDVQTRILTVPSIVAERLLGRKHLKEGPTELTELVKSYLAWLDEQGGAESVCKAAAAAAMAGDCGRVADWIGALRFCPREILDLIDSKACRGAIMFGDRLSLAQGADLVRRLAQTKLPLQCAHGRPSMALVADLGALQRRSRGAERCRQAIAWEELAPVGPRAS